MLGRRLLWIVMRGGARLMCILAFRVRVFGQNRVPKTGGVLVVSNHQSFLDPLLVGVGLGRSVSYMARDTLWRRKAFGWLITGLNCFPVARGGRDIAALREAVKRLRRGECLVVFPEGTRSRDGNLGTLLQGVVAIADRAGVPIVPAMVDGAWQAWPRSGGIRLLPIRVAYAKPIPAAERAGLGRAAALARLRQEMLTLQAELRRK